MKLDASLLVVICGEPLQLVKASLCSFEVFSEVYILDMLGNPQVEEIAKSHNYIYEVIPRKPIVEEIRVKYLHKLTREWVSFLDPDEVVRLDSKEVYKINSLLSDGHVDVLKIKWVFHFKGKPLEGGYWRPTSKAFLLNKSTVGISGLVHGGYSYDKNRELALTPRTAVLDHYWVYSLSSFFEKHFRYIIAEKNKKIQNNSPQIGYLKLFKIFLRKLKSYYILNKGYRDGMIGIFLAFFHVFYTLAPEVLYRFTSSKSLN